MEEYIERALALGMEEFGFSEHSPWMVQDPGQWNCLKWDEMPQYLDDVARLRERYNRDGDRPFRLRLGMEADYVPSRVGLAREVFAAHPWDTIIGSVHHLGFWCLPKSSESPEYLRHSMDDVCELYFELVGRMVRDRFCDVIGHIDLPKKHDNRPAGGTMLRWIEPLIPLIKTNEIAVEINTSGLDHPVGEVFPSWDVIEALAAAGVMLQVNSDSHAPEHVGRHFDRVYARLGELGVRALVRFEGRRPVAVPLPEVSGSPSVTNF
jgi:histidinol-phosphatase (PHP family)